MSRAEILGRIQRGLHRGPLPAEQQDALRARLAAHPRHLVPARGQLPPADRVTLFLTILAKEHGTSARIAAPEDAPAAVATYLAAQNLPPAAVIAPHPDLRAIPWSATPLLTLREGPATGDDAVGIQHAWAALAETGTLVLPSAPDRPQTINLLPETVIVLLRASHVLPAMEDAWDLLRHEQENLMPRTVMFVTGPSRSADVEQILELGAHGPRRLHVLLLDDTAP
jgi:L-lactate dehydrogenase complex protein LldG